ncbi:glycyl-radical enzyme activating protein [Streptococcus pneumoniae]|nr:glycyl-radical enzyme activating protein [Streptococcus pneumoniae]
MEISKGIIFNIQHFSIHDGPGIRTTVFLKGCPLRCPWCSNPESQRMKPEKMKDAQREKFTLVGEEKTVEEIITEVLKDKEFYEESGGGLTLSGGEIFAQFEFAKAILKLAKEHHIHTAIETTAFVDHEKFIDLIQYVDFIYTDLKHYNSIKHKKVTGVFNQMIIKNIHYAFSQNKTIVLRIPVIPNFNNSLEDAEKFATLFNSLNIDQVQLLPFHQFGENKYRLLNRKYEMDGINALHPEDLIDYQKVFLNHHINCYF